MRSIMSKWGKHIAAIAVFLVLTVIYFSPAVFEGKVVRQGDTEKAIGMGNSQMDEYEKTAQPGEFSAWSDAMFGGMPYVSGYGNPAPRFPGYLLVEKPLKALGYMDAGMVFTGFVCFYILMCVMGVNWWLAIAGAIAFALASYNLIIIEAGHVTKAYVIAYMPLTLAGMALLFKRKYLWGAVVFLLGVAFSIANTHLQITYYLLLLCFFVYLGYLFNKLKEKAYKELGTVTAIMAGCVILTVIYFSPAVFEGKVVRQGDTEKAIGMGNSQMDEYEKTAQPGEFSAWSDAMFGGMPYVSGYGNPAPRFPGYLLVEKPLKALGYMDAGMVFTGFVCFYILMCVMGVNWWLAIAGAIAFALASYNLIIIEAGHVTKAYVIAYMPLTLAGMALLFKRKYLWGAVVFLLGVAFSIANTHLQITYYLLLLCFFVYLGYLFNKLKEKAYKELGTVTAIMAGCVILAVLPNAQNMYAQWDLGQNSIRGATELTTTTPSGEKISSGLDKDYAFAWSYGKGELLTLLVPNAYGGSSGGMLGPDSELYKELRAKGAQVGKEVQAPTYWGEKTFTSGPVYFGALVCFLFVLGMFVIRNPMKWWLFGGSVFLILLALGRNFDSFNDFMFHYLPMYNKFRTVEMALVIPGMVFPIIAIWGLKEVLSEAVSDALLKRGLIAALAITGGLSLILWLMPSMLLDFRSSFDAQYQLPDWYYNALLMDRASLASADALRSLVFILLGAALLFWFYTSKDRKKVATFVGIGVAVLMLVDLWTVDKRYLNDSNFIRQKPTEVYKETVADQEIMKDKDLSYRVLNLNNPFLETTTSYYHHSVGGYYAAKLRRYQELIDHRLQGELNSVIGAFQKAQTAEDLMGAFAACPSLNMLNTRYIIYNPEQPPLRNPFAFGNAWFVDKVEVVENADAEIAALNTINPLTTAVVDKRFANEVKGFTPQLDSTATITLDSYRPNKLVYTTKANSEQLAVFSEIYYQPGWEATIDGKPAPHFRADWILRAMLVPAGEHQIVFEFRPQGYITAAYITSFSSLIILLLLIGAVGYSVWKARKQKEI